MTRDIGERFATLADISLSVRAAQNNLLARLVRIGVEDERARLTELPGAPGKCPAGDDAGKRRHVGLRIAAVHAECMQLENLAREILVQTAAGALAGRRIRADRKLVIEIEQHCRMTFDSLQHVTEPAEYVGADRIALECARGDTDKAALHRRDAEMVSQN